MAESAWMARKRGGNPAWICAWRSNDSNLERLGADDLLFDGALVPGLVGLPLGVAQLRRHAGHDQLGGRHAGDGVHARRFGGAITGGGRWAAGGSVPCHCDDVWRRKTTSRGGVMPHV